MVVVWVLFYLERKKRKNGKIEVFGNFDFKLGFFKLSCYYEVNNFSVMKFLYKNVK